MPKPTYGPISQNGGKRAGAGRKKGVPNKVTKELRAEALKGGVSPLTMMVDIARSHYRDWKSERRKPVLERNDDTIMAKSKAALEAAERAAPYLHRRQPAQQADGDGDAKNGTLRVVIVNDPDADS